ncbi:MAG: Flp family type IVb pilin [Chloroflexi bacterium]|nr:Flp family type IVb pilin [Chloroflexota bacterium]
MWYALLNWLRREEGQDLTEYALIIGLIVVVAIAAVALLGGNVQSLLNAVAGALGAATNNVP